MRIYPALQRCGKTDVVRSERTGFGLQKNWAVQFQATPQADCISERQDYLQRQDMLWKRTKKGRTQSGAVLCERFQLSFFVYEFWTEDRLWSYSQSLTAGVSRTADRVVKLQCGETIQVVKLLSQTGANRIIAGLLCSINRIAGRGLGFRSSWLAAAGGQGAAECAQQQARDDSSQHFFFPQEGSPNQKMTTMLASTEFNT